MSLPSREFHQTRLSFLLKIGAVFGAAWTAWTGFMAWYLTEDDLLTASLVGEVSSPSLDWRPSMSTRSVDMKVTLNSGTEASSVVVHPFNLFPGNPFVYQGVSCVETGKGLLPAWLTHFVRMISPGYDAGQSVQDVGLVNGDPDRPIVAIYNDKVRTLNASNPSDAVPVLDTEGTFGATFAVASQGGTGYSASNNPGIYSFSIASDGAMSSLDNYDVPGAAFDIKITSDGQTGYVATSVGLFVADTSDPSNLAQAGSFSSTSFSSVGLIDDDTVVLTSSTQLVFADATNRASPSSLGAYTTGGTPAQVVTRYIGAQRIAYVADTTAVRILDITNYSSVVELDSIVATANGVYFDEETETLFVGEGAAGASVWDVSDNMLARKAVYDTSGSARRLISKQGRLYIADDTSNELVVHLREDTIDGTTAPAVVSRPYAVTCTADQQFEASANATQSITFNTPVEVAPIAPVSVDFDKNTTFTVPVTDADGGSIKVSGPFDTNGDVPTWANLTVTPDELGSAAATGTPQALAVNSADTLSFVGTASGLQSFYVADPSSIQPLDSVSFDVVSVAVLEKSVVITHSDGTVEVVDQRNPTFLKSVSTFATPGFANDSAALSATVVLVADGAAGVSSVTADPSGTPGVIDTLNIGATALKVEAQDNQAVAMTATGLTYVNASDSSSLSQQGSYVTFASPIDVSIHGNLTAVASASVIELVDSSDSASPQQHSIYNLPEPARSTAFWGDSTLLVATNNFILVLDCSDPMQLKEVGRFAANNPSSVSATNRLIYFTDADGQHVLRLRDWMLSLNPNLSADSFQAHVEAGSPQDATVMSNSFEIRVEKPPVGTPINADATVGFPFNFLMNPDTMAPYFTEPNGDPITDYTATNVPSWSLYLNGPTGGIITGTPPVPGVEVASVCATDGRYPEPTCVDFNINVGQPPTLIGSLPDLPPIREDRVFEYRIEKNAFSNPSGLTFSVERIGGGDLPSWLTVVETSSEILLTGTPPSDAVGSQALQLIARDASGATTTEFIGLNVQANLAPQTGELISNHDATVGREFRMTFSDRAFNDPNGDPITYQAFVLNTETNTLGDLPRWLNFDPETRTFWGKPGPDDKNAFTDKKLRIVILGSDGSDEPAGRNEFDLTVTGLSRWQVAAAVIGSLTFVPTMAVLVWKNWHNLFNRCYRAKKKLETQEWDAGKEGYIDLGLSADEKKKIQFVRFKRRKLVDEEQSCRTCQSGCLCFKPSEWENLPNKDPLPSWVEYDHEQPGLLKIKNGGPGPEGPAEYKISFKDSKKRVIADMTLRVNRGVELYESNRTTAKDEEAAVWHELIKRFPAGGEGAALEGAGVGVTTRGHTANVAAAGVFAQGAARGGAGVTSTTNAAFAVEGEDGVELAVLGGGAEQVAARA